MLAEKNKLRSEAKGIAKSIATGIAKCIGRQKELEMLRACIEAKKNVLLEGPVGVGKTHLALAATCEFSVPVFRVDGDSRYSEQKLTGWFDPPSVIKKGFSKDSFFAGPLVEAMQSGGILFINELNRLPEGVQNILLPAIDEQVIMVPRLGEIRAKLGFLVLATQNPKEFVATSHLSEAILDRFELVVIDYQSEGEEIEILKTRLGKTDLEKQMETLLVQASVQLCRLTRQHPQVRRGASVRAALSISQLCAVFLKHGKKFEQAFVQAALLSLPTRIEMERNAESGLSTQEETAVLIKGWIDQILKKKL